jgi:hypothetical protein
MAKKVLLLLASEHCWCRLWLAPSLSQLTDEVDESNGARTPFSIFSTRAPPRGVYNGDYRECFIAAVRTHVAAAAHTRTHDQQPQLAHDALRNAIATAGPLLDQVLRCTR